MKEGPQLHVLMAALLHIASKSKDIVVEEIAFKSKEDLSEAVRQFSEIVGYNPSNEDHIIFDYDECTETKIAIKNGSSIVLLVAN